MSYIARWNQLFRSAGGEGEQEIVVQPKRSEGRMKTYQSATDSRAWILSEELRRQYLIDLINSSSPQKVSLGKFVPLEALIDLLLANKDADIEKLRQKMSKLEQMLEAYKQLNLTDEQKKQLSKMVGKLKDSEDDLQAMSGPCETPRSGLSGVSTKSGVSYKTTDGDEFETEEEFSEIGKTAEEVEEEDMHNRMMNQDYNDFSVTELREMIVKKDTDIFSLQKKVQALQQEVEEKTKYAILAIRKLEHINNVMMEKDKQISMLSESQDLLQTLPTGKAKVRVKPDDEAEAIKSELAELKSYCNKLSDIEKENEILLEDRENLRKQIKELTGVSPVVSELITDGIIKSDDEKSVGSTTSKKSILSKKSSIKSATAKKSKGSCCGKSIKSETGSKKCVSIKSCSTHKSEASTSCRNLEQSDGEDFGTPRGNLTPEEYECIIDNLRCENVNLQSMITELQPELDVHRQRSQALDEVIKERDELEGRVTKAKGKKDDAECKIQFEQMKELKLKLRRAMDEIRLLRMQLTDSVRLKEELERTRFMTHELAPLRAERDALKKKQMQLFQLEDEYKVLVEENMNLKNERSFMQQKIQEQEIGMTAMENEIRKLVTELEHVSRSCDCQQDRMKFAIRQLRKQIEEKDHKILELSEEMEKIKTETLNLQEQLANSIKGIEGELEKAKNSEDRHMKELFQETKEMLDMLLNEIGGESIDKLSTSGLLSASVINELKNENDKLRRVSDEIERLAEDEIRKLIEQLRVTIGENEHLLCEVNCIKSVLGLQRKENMEISRSLKDILGNRQILQNSASCQFLRTKVGKLQCERGQLGIAVESLKKANENFQTEVNGLKKQVAELKIEKSELEKQLNKEREENAREKNEMNNMHEKEKKEMINMYEKEKCKITQIYEKKIEDMINKYEKEKQDMINKYEKEKQDMIKKYEKEKQDMINKYEKEKQDLINKYEKEKQDMINKYESEKCQIMQKCEKEKQDMMNKYEKEKQDMINNYEKEKQDMMNNYEKEKQEMVNKYEKAIQEMMDTYEKEKCKAAQKAEKEKQDMISKFENEKQKLMSENAILLKGKEAAEKENSELKCTCNQLSNGVNALKEGNENLKNKISKLIDQVTEKDRLIHRLYALECQNKSSLLEIQILKEQLCQLRHAMKCQMKAVLTQVEKIGGPMVFEDEECDEEKKKLEEAVDGVEKKICNLLKGPKEFEELKQKYEDLLKQLESLKGGFTQDDLEELRRQYEAQISDLNQALDDQRKKCAEEIAKLEEIKKKYEDQMEDLNNFLAEQRKKCEEEIDNLKKEAALTSELESLKTKNLEEINNLKKSLEDQKSQYESELEKLRKQLEDSNKDLAAMKAAYEAQLAELRQSLEEQKKMCEEENAKLKKELDSANAEAESMKKKFEQQLEEQKKQAESDNESKKKFEDQISNLNQAMADQKKGYEDKINNLNKMMADQKKSLEDEIAKITAQFLAASKALEDLQKKYDEQEKIIDQLKAELSSSGELKTKYESQIKDLNKSLEDQKKSYEDEISRLKNELLALNNELESFKKDSEAKINGLMKSLEDQKNKCESDMNKLRNDLSAASNDELEALKKKFEAQIKALEAEKANCEEQMKKCGDMDNKNKELQSELDELRKKLAEALEAAGNMDALRKQYEDQINSLKAEHAAAMEKAAKQYEDDLKTIKAQYDRDLKNVHTKHTDSVAKLSKVHEESLHDVTGELERELDNLRATNKELMKENENLKKKITELEEKIKSLEEELEKCKTPEEPKKKCRCTKKKPLHVENELNQKIGASPSMLDVLNKILDNGMESLDLHELSMLHARTCTIASKKVKEEEMPTSPANQMQLLSRIELLEQEVVNKQQHAAQKLNDLETAVNIERKRLAEMKRQLETTKNQNMHLQTELKNQVRQYSDVELERQLLHRQASLHEARAQESFASLEEEKARVRSLEDDLQKERNNVKHLKALLEAERQRSSEMKRKERQATEEMRRKLEHTLNSETTLRNQLQVVRQRGRRSTTGTVSSRDNSVTTRTRSTVMRYSDADKTEHFVHHCSIRTSNPKEGESKRSCSCNHCS